MAETSADVPRHAIFTADPPTRVVDVARYGLSLIAVTAIAVAFALWNAAPPSHQDASEVDNAVLVDLPPADASAQPPREANDSPEQPAVAPPTSAAEPPKTAQEIQPRVWPDAERPQESKGMNTAPPQPAQTPAAPPQSASAPEAAEPSTLATADDSSEAQPHASAHAITLWQKSLMRRLETAKRVYGRETYSPGTAEIAFDIDRTGALVSERIARSSGSASLDKTALLLVRQAAPYPAPPPGSRPLDMSFIVPIRFR